MSAPTKRVARQPDRIWLAPPCHAETFEGRFWCEDDCWGGCDECGNEDCASVEYVRADLARAAPDADAGRVAELRELQTLCQTQGVADGNRIAELERRIERARSLIGSYGRPGQAGNLIKALAILSGDADA